MSLSSIESPAPGPDLIRRAREVGGTVARRYGLLIGVLAFWQVASTTGLVNAAIFPPLTEILSALWTALASGKLIPDIAISLQRSGLAFGFAVALGIPLGLALLHKSREGFIS